MTSIVAYTIASQTNYHIIIFVCCSLLIVIILHMLCIVFEHVEHGDLSEHEEPVENGDLIEREEPVENGDLSEHGEPVEHSDLSEHEEPVEHSDLSEHGEPCEHIFTERVNPIINFNTVKSHNRKKQSTMLTENKCNALKRNGSSCRRDGNKSGGKIINGYCVYHKKMRK